MTKLEKLYQTLQNLKELNLKVDDDLLQQANELEEQLIKEEVLPALTKDIEPILSKIQRDLVLVVEYHPNMPIGVALSRKTNISELIDAKKIEMDPEVIHGSRVTDKMDGQIKHGPTTHIRIKFPNGEVIEEKHAADTLETFVRRVGIERVRKVVEEKKLVFSRVPVISNRRDKKYGNSQRRLVGNWLLITHSNNKAKVSFIKTVSEALKLGVKVDTYK